MYNFLRWSKVSDPSWCGPTFVPASKNLHNNKDCGYHKQLTSISCQPIIPHLCILLTNKLYIFASCNFPYFFVYKYIKNTTATHIRPSDATDYEYLNSNKYYLNPLEY